MKIVQFIGGQCNKINKYGIVILSNTDNSITDIGLHILDPSNEIKPYQYKWHLLDKLYSIIQSEGIDKGLAQYNQVKSIKSSIFYFEPMQLYHLGNELRRKNKINEAIKIFELNAVEYPDNMMVYESLAEIHKRYGDKMKAKLYFEKLVATDPKNTRWAYLLNKLNSQN